MDVEKLLKLSIDHLSDYFGVLFSTLRSPKVEFPPEMPPTEFTIVSPGSGTQVRGARFNPKLLGFLLVSIFVGSVFNTNVAGRGAAPEFAIMAVMVVGYWLLFSSLAHLICRAFGGREAFAQTLSLNLQVLAVIHVMSSFITFLWGVGITGSGLGKDAAYLQGPLGRTLIESPIYAYFIIQFVLVLIYLPLANRRLHKFYSLRPRRGIASRALTVLLARTETALFYVIFLVLSITIAGLSRANYLIHNVPLSQPEVSMNLRGDVGKDTGTGKSLLEILEEASRRGEDADDMVVAADVYADGTARLTDVKPQSSLSMIEEFQNALRQNPDFVPAPPERRPQTMRVVFTLEKMNMADSTY
ncbi:MAG TPA: hypothetical protein VF297_22100 [Pyrinomonadaceae bacterium]